MISIPLSLSYRIRDIIRGATRIGFVFHRNPDGDSLGAGLALALYAASIGKSITLYCITGVPPVFGKLPLIADIHTDPAIFDKEVCDVVVVSDAGDAAFAGIDGIVAIENAMLINIDHHPTNTRYGDVNLIVPTAASTTEVVYGLLTSWGVALSPNIATMLLLGLLNDTDEFSNPGTSASALAVGAALINAGADYETARQCLRVGKRLSALPVWGRVLSSLTHDNVTGIARAVVAQEMLEGVSPNAVEGIPNFLNCLKDVAMTVVVKEQSNGTVHTSFRTVRDDVDVAALAQSFGGGGHRKAAGYSVVGRLEKGADGQYSLREEPNE